MPVKARYIHPTHQDPKSKIPMRWINPAPTNNGRRGNSINQLHAVSLLCRFTVQVQSRTMGTNSNPEVGKEEMEDEQENKKQEPRNQEPGQSPPLKNRRQTLRPQGTRTNPSLSRKESYFKKRKEKKRRGYTKEPKNIDEKSSIPIHLVRQRRLRRNRSTLPTQTPLQNPWRLCAGCRCQRRRGQR